MTREGTMVVTAADHAWGERVLDVLRGREQRPVSLFDVTVEMPPRFEPDPFWDRPPRELRAKLRWIWRCASFKWWDPPVVEQATRWEFANVSFKVEMGFAPPETVVERELPFTWSRTVLSRRGLDIVMRRLYGPGADSEGMGV